MTGLFFTILRSVAIPFVAYLFLKETPLGEQGAVLAIGVATLITSLVSIFWNIIKIIPNTILLRGNSVLLLIMRIGVQVISVAFIWAYYAYKFTDLLK